MMLRNSCRVTAAMCGMASLKVSVGETKNSDEKTREKHGVPALGAQSQPGGVLQPQVKLVEQLQSGVKLFPVVENAISVVENTTPVVENATAALGPGGDIHMSTEVSDLSGALGGEAGEEGAGDERKPKERYLEEFELVEVDVVRPNEQGRQQAEADKLKAAIAKARDLSWCKMYESGTPGMIVAIAVNGKLVWQHGFGYSDVENKLLAGTGCVMRIASISKPMTMAVLAKLVEEGKVDLDETIDKYVKDWPHKSVDGEDVVITVRQLASHLAGIRHYEKKGKDKENQEFEMKEYYIKESFETTAKAVDLFKNDELMSKPGDKFLYSTHGFTLLAAVIETVTEEPFDKYMKKQFKELGLNNTYLDENQPLIYNRARYYVRDKHHRLQNAPYVDNSYKWAGGGYLSNVSDLIKFGNAMLYSYQYSGQPDKKADLEINKKELKEKIDIPSKKKEKIPEDTKTGPEGGDDSKAAQPDKKADLEINKKELKEKIDIPSKKKEKIPEDTKTGPEGGDDSKAGELPKETPAQSINCEEIMGRDIVYHPGPFAAINSAGSGGCAVPGYLSKKMMQELWTVQPHTNLSWGGDQLGYGLGWAVVPVKKRYAFCENQYYYVSHTGGAIGASSVLLIAPNKTQAGETKLPQGIVVAVLANLQGVQLNKLAKSIAQAFEGLSMEKPVRVQKVYQC